MVQNPPGVASPIPILKSLGRLRVSGSMNVQMALELTPILDPELHTTGIVLKSTAVKGNIDPLLFVPVDGVGVLGTVVVGVGCCVVGAGVGVKVPLVPIFALELVATLIPLICP